MAMPPYGLQGPAWSNACIEKKKNKDKQVGHPSVALSKYLLDRKTQDGDQKDGYKKIGNKRAAEAEALNENTQLLVKKI